MDDTQKLHEQDVAATIHELNIQLRAKDAKYKILQNIVETQDRHILDLENRLSVLPYQAVANDSDSVSDDSARYWRQEYEKLREIVSSEQEKTSAAKSAEVAQLERELQNKKAEHDRDHETWQREKQTLLSLLDRSQATASNLETTLFEERREMERRIQSDVKALTLGSGRVETAIEESLRAELNCATETITELRRQLADSNRMLDEQRSELLTLLSKEKENAKVDRDALNHEIQTLVEQVQEKGQEIVVERQAWEEKVQKLRAQVLDDKRKNAAKVADLEKHIKEANFNLLSYSRGIMSSTPKQQSENSPLQSNQGASNAAAVVMMPKHMRDEFEQRLLDVLKAKEEVETRLCAERQQLLEDVEKHDIHRDRRIAVLVADSKARLNEQQMFVDLLEKRQQFLELELQKSNNRVLRAENSAKEREAMAYAELQETHKFYESQMKDLEHALAHTMESNKQFRQTAQEKHEALLHAEKRFASQIQEMIENVKVLENQHGAANSNRSRRTNTIETKKLEAVGKELREVRVIYKQCQQELEQAQQQSLAQTTELQTQLAQQSDLAIKMRQEHKIQIESFREESRLLRETMEEANVSHSRAEELAAEEISRLNQKLEETLAWTSSVESDCANAIKSAEAAAAAQALAHQEHTTKLRNLLVFVQSDFQSHRERTEVELSNLRTENETLRNEQQNVVELLHQKEEIHRKFAVAESACRVVLTKCAVRAKTELEGEKQRLHEMAERWKDGHDLVSRWNRRQQAVTFQRQKTEQELVDTLAELAQVSNSQDAAVDVISQEVRALRILQDKHLRQVEATRQLGEAGQLRLQAEIDAVERRVTVAEQALVEEQQQLVVERKALMDINRLAEDLANQKEQSIARDLNDAQRESQVARDRLEEHLIAMQDEKRRVSSQLESISGISRRHDEAAQTTRSALYEQLSATKEYATDKLRHAEEQVERFKVQVKLARKMAENTAKTSERELRSLHGELRHLRLSTSEKQLLIAREKQVLVEEVSSLRSENAEKLEQAKKVFEVNLKLQSQGTKLSQDELRELESRVEDQEQKHMEDLSVKEEHHKNDIRSLQHGLSILRAMEQEREKTSLREMSILRNQMMDIQRSLSERQSTDAKGLDDMKSQVEKLRQEMANSEARLKEQRHESENRRQSLLGRLDRASKVATNLSSKSSIPGRRRPSSTPSHSVVQ